MESPYQTICPKILDKAPLLKKGFNHEKIEEKVHKDDINLLSCRNWYIYILNFYCKCKQAKPTNCNMCQSENAAKVNYA